MFKWRLINSKGADAEEAILFIEKSRKPGLFGDARAGECLKGSCKRSRDQAWAPFTPLPATVVEGR